MIMIMTTFYIYKLEVIVLQIWSHLTRLNFLSDNKNKVEKIPLYVLYNNFPSHTFITTTELKGGKVS